MYNLRTNPPASARLFSLRQESTSSVSFADTFPVWGRLYKVDYEETTGFFHI